MTSYLLLPGAGGTAWYWARVAALLEKAGHTAVAVEFPGDDPGSGLPEYATCAIAVAPAGPITVVAQSMGGFTAPFLWQALPVERVVFVNAMIPNPGERPGEWWGNVRSSEAREAAARAGGYSEEFDIWTYFLHDVPDDVAKEGEPYQRPEADRAFADVCDFAQWPIIPVRVVAGADDRFFPVEFQQRVARERLGIEADVLPGGHLIALSQPEAVAAYLSKLDAQSS